MVEIDSAPSLNAVSHNKKSASVWQAVVPGFDPDKKSAVLQQKIGQYAATLKGHCHAIWQLYKKLGVFASIKFQN